MLFMSLTSPALTYRQHHRWCSNTDLASWITERKTYKKKKRQKKKKKHPGIRMTESGTPSAWLTQMIISSDWMNLTWGVEQPPGDCRVRPATGQAAECHIAALVHCDVFWHLVDVGWNWRKRRNDIEVNSTAIIHKRKEQSVFYLREIKIGVNLESASVYSRGVKLIQ